MSSEACTKFALLSNTTWVHDPILSTFPSETIETSSRLMYLSIYIDRPGYSVDYISSICLEPLYMFILQCKWMHSVIHVWK